MILKNPHPGIILLLVILLRSRLIIEVTLNRVIMLVQIPDLVLDHEAAIHAGHAGAVPRSDGPGSLFDDAGFVEFFGEFALSERSGNGVGVVVPSGDGPFSKIDAM